ncbi:MAG: hypothetical protein IPK29_04045 [Betaproteobacteria bacterium]|nr:hypothetical protein [Betaproteobacteria bacterium]
MFDLHGGLKQIPGARPQIQAGTPAEEDKHGRMIDLERHRTVGVLAQGIQGDSKRSGNFNGGRSWPGEAMAIA